MELRECDLEVSYANSVVCALRDLLCPVVHCVKFTDLVGVSNLLEEELDLVSGPWSSEVVLLNANFRVVRWEEEINCLWLITIVLVVGD